MHKWNVLKKTAPVFLSLAVAATSMPTTILAADAFGDGAVVETEDVSAEEVSEDDLAEEASTDDLTESKDKDKTSGVISGSSEKKEKSIPELVGSKVTNTWTHMRSLTKVLSVFALAGLIYLIFWTGARRSFRKMKNRNPLLQR